MTVQNHSVCSLKKFAHVFNVVKLFLKRPVCILYATQKGEKNCHNIVKELLIVLEPLSIPPTIISVTAYQSRSR
jgi:hypothetical protein